MTQIAHINRDAAKQDPGAVFANPQALVDEIMLTRGEKLATLDRWRQMILQEMAAAGEGMRTHGVSGQLSETLAQIDAARANLQEHEQPPA